MDSPRIHHEQSKPALDSVRVLFVCHANVCRSPLAEGIFRHVVLHAKIHQRFVIDSAGTMAMSNTPPHTLSFAIALSNGIELSGLSRQLVRNDLFRTNEMIVMDRQNRADIKRLATQSAFGPDVGNLARIRTLREVTAPAATGADLDIPDPIGKGTDAYTAVYKLIRTGCDALLAEFS